MPWDIRKDLHLDINAHYGAVLLRSATDSSLLTPPPDFHAGDKFDVRLHFWERGPSGTLVAADPGADTVLVFTARPNNLPPGSDLLFYLDDFAEIEAGVWEGTLDLNTAELGAHLAAAPSGPKTITGELEVRDSVADTRRLSLQFPLTARPQSYDNQDPPAFFSSVLTSLDARVGTLEAGKFALTLLAYGGAGNAVEGYNLSEWAAFGVIDGYWKPASSGLKGLHIAEGVTEIGQWAFTTNSSLSGVVNFPASLRTLGPEAFSNCILVKGFGLNQGLETIGNSAFDGCTGVVGDLVIPDSVTSIGGSAFESWTAAGTLTLGSGLLTIGASAFAGTAFTGDLVIPPSVTAIGDNAFDGATGFGDLILNEGLLTIGAEAFADVNATNEITIPLTVTSIGAAAFENGTFTSANCYVTSTIVEGSSAIFLNSALNALHVRASDSTWTAGVQVVGANPGVNVIKDL